MDAEGLALVALSLFSMLKKQPGNAPVYLPRRMAGAGGSGGSGGVLLSLRTGRLTPSFRWIHAAFGISDNDVLRRHGLDALAIIRLFKFGIKCFSVCSIVGVLVLAPVNYTSEGPSDPKRHNSMELFTVSNVPKDSDRKEGQQTQEEVHKRNLRKGATCFAARMQLLNQHIQTHLA